MTPTTVSRRTMHTIQSHVFTKNLSNFENLQTLEVKNIATIKASDLKSIDKFQNQVSQLKSTLIDKTL